MAELPLEGSAIEASITSLRWLVVTLVIVLMLVVLVVGGEGVWCQGLAVVALSRENSSQCIIYNAPVRTVGRATVQRPYNGTTVKSVAGTPSSTIPLSEVSHVDGDCAG